MAGLMMMTAVTRIERRLATQHVFDTVNRLGGWIDDVKMYSNLMNTIRLTLPAGAFTELAASLGDLGIVMEQPQVPGGKPNAERMGTLALTFIHDEPDLRREVPAVPG